MLVTESVCPETVRMGAPESASHTRMVSSELPLAIVRLSGLNATLLTESVCP